MVHLLNNDNRPIHENDLAYIEPRFCMDPNCTFPFGDICTECEEYYEARNVSKEDDFTSDGQGDDGKAASKKGGDSIFSSTGENKLVISITDTEELVARRSLWLGELFERTVEYQTQGRVFVGGAIPEADETERLNPTIEKSSPTSSNIGSSSVRDQIGDEYVKADPLVPMVTSTQDEDPHPQRTAKPNVDNLCPICGQPQGDPHFQHYLRCKYAHEENERLQHMYLRRGR